MIDSGVRYKMRRLEKEFEAFQNVAQLTHFGRTVEIDTLRERIVVVKRNWFILVRGGHLLWHCGLQGIRIVTFLLKRRIFWLLVDGQ